MIITIDTELTLTPKERQILRVVLGEPNGHEVSLPLTRAAQSEHLVEAVAAEQPAAPEPPEPAEDLVDAAIKRATDLLESDRATDVKNALVKAGGTKVSALTPEQAAVFLEALS